MITRLKQLLFQNRSTKQTVAKNAFWLSVGEIGARVIRGGIIIYAARVLGAENFGIFSYALGLAGFFTLFADVGVNAILTREVSQKTDQKTSYFATSFAIKSLLLLFTALVVIFIAPSFSKIDAAKALVPFVALLTIADGIREFTLAFFRALEKMEVQALISLVTNVSIAIFGFVVLYFSATAEALTFSYIASAGAGAGTAVFLLRKEFKKVYTFFDKKLIYPIIKSAWPIAIISTVGAFTLNIDVLMIGWFKDAEAVGLYSASQKIVVVLYAIPSILAMALFPTFSRFIGKETPERVRALTEEVIPLTLALAFPMTAGGIILGKGIITFAYGAQFASAAVSFQILIATLLFTFPGPVLGNMILGYDKQKSIAPFFGLASVSNVALNYVLIPIYGIPGAAIATLVTQGANNFGVWFVAKQINNFHTLRYLKKIFIATLLMSMASYFMSAIHIHVIQNIALSAILYAAILFVLKERVVLEIFGFFKRI